MDAAAVYREFVEEYAAAAEKYYEKRVEMIGVVRKICPDIHNKPFIEFSDQVDGRCYVLFIVESAEFYSRISMGEYPALPRQFPVRAGNPLARCCFYYG